MKEKPKISQRRSVAEWEAGRGKTNVALVYLSYNAGQATRADRRVRFILPYLLKRIYFCDIIHNLRMPWSPPSFHPQLLQIDSPFKGFLCPLDSKAIHSLFISWFMLLVFCRLVIYLSTGLCLYRGLPAYFSGILMTMSCLVRRKTKWLLNWNCFLELFRLPRWPIDWDWGGE